ncbi:MAG: hypothetical protein AAB354_05420 [candidate division KSB1 bacterium]
MDDQSFFLRRCQARNTIVKQPLRAAIPHCSLPNLGHASTKNCINLIWCVFLLVTAAVNISAQEIANLTVPDQTQVLVSESLRYRMLTGSLEVGRVTVNIVNESHDEFVHIVESVTGLIERTTTLLIKKDSILSSNSSYTIMSKASLTQEIQLQYESNTVSGTVVQPERSGGARKVNATFFSKTEDYYIVPYFLRSCVLQKNRVIKFPVYEALRNRVELARGWVVKLEEVEVPVGKFACYRLEGFTGNLRWILFFDKQFPHRLIKQQFPALYLQTELIEVTPNT